MLKQTVNERGEAIGEAAKKTPESESGDVGSLRTQRGVRGNRLPLNKIL